MSIEATATSSKNDKFTSKQVLQVPFNSQVFHYTNTLLKNVISNDERIDDKLARALHFFATGEYCHEDEDILEVVNVLVAIAPQFIKFPVGEELFNIQHRFYELSQRTNDEFGFPNIIGVIDCDYVHFEAVDEQEYVNSNSGCSMNVQFVCGPDLQLYNVLAAFPGSYDKLKIWQSSRLRQNFQQQCIENKCWLIGDSEYIQDSALMIPINDAKLQAEELYNQSHADILKCIKRCKQLLKTRFKCLDSVLRFAPDKVCAITIACCVLHNLCILHDDFIEIEYDEADESHIEDSVAQSNLVVQKDLEIPSSNNNDVDNK